MIKFIADPPPWVKDESSKVTEWANRQFRRIQDMWDQPRWDDLRAPASNLTRGATAPGVNTTYGWLDFAYNLDEFVWAQFQLPHEWVVGTNLYPHCHWCKTTTAAGEVEWQFQYRWMRIGEVIDGSWTTSAVLTPSVSDGDTANQHALTRFAEIDVDGVQISDMLICKLTRLGSSYSGSNHYTADAGLIELDIHYQYDRGSRQEYIK